MSRNKCWVCKKDLNFTDEELEHFFSPTGLELLANTPEEIALSILSEMVMLANGGTGKHKRVLNPDNYKLKDKS